MSTDWSAVRRVFEELVELDDETRATRLDELCGQDDELRSGVRRLLDHAHDDEFLSTPTPATRLGLFRSTPTALTSGTRFAGYEILRRLGSGGMGDVYEARQTQPARLVALKILRAGVGEAAAARFRWEADVLARLHHPGVAQVFAAGVEPVGEGDEVPWFAMELVEDATPITTFVRTRELDVDAVLTLFADVCEAVQHGHAHGVIHRDLKASNVLVDGEGVVKVIDFGVAHVGERNTELTRAGDLIGTLGTMSPEQLGSDPSAVDARTDVYALGAILHELLCGHPLHDLTDCSITEVARRVRSETPMRASTRRPGLPPDLDWIVARATDVDPERRYPTASELAADVRRFLEKQPLVAGPPDTSYRVRAFLRQHRVAVVTVGAVLVALVAGVISTTVWMFEARRQADVARFEQQRADEQRDAADAARREAEDQRVAADDARAVAEGERAIAESERQRAEEEAARATAVTDFVVGLIRSPDPSLDGREVRVVDILDRADELIERSLAEQPELAFALHTTLGRLHFNLGLHAEAEHHLDQALVLADSDDDALAVQHDLGTVHRAAGRLGEAEDELRATLATRIERLGDDDPEVALTRAALALVVAEQGLPAEALSLYEEALAVLVPAFGDDYPAVLSARSNLAGLHSSQARYVEAAEIYEDLLPRMREQIGPNDHVTLAALSNFAGLQVALGNRARAATLLDEVIAARRRLLPPDHPGLIGDLSNLAVLRHALGESAAGAELLAEVLTRRADADPWLPDVVLMRCNRLFMLGATGDIDASEAAVTELVEIDLGTSARDVRAVGYLETVTPFIGFSGWSEQGITLAEDCLEARLRLAPDDVPALLRCYGRVALTHAFAGRPTDGALAAIAELARRLDGSAREDALGAVKQEWSEWERGQLVRALEETLSDPGSVGG